MAQRSDVLVVGGGIIGVCVAHFLAESGAQVTLLEKDEVCSGASYGNAGLIVPSHGVPLAAPGVVAKGLRWLLNPESPLYIRPRLDFALLAWLWRFWRSCTETHVRQSLPLLTGLQQESLRLFEQLVAEGITCGFQRKGTMTVFKTDRAFEEGQHEAQLLREHGVSTEVLTGEEARKKEPLLREDVIGAVFFPDDAHLDPAAFTLSLAERLHQRGVKILARTMVTGWEVQGRRVVAAKTPQGAYQAEVFVLAAGAWSPLLTRELGISLPVQPAKGYSITLHNPSRLPSLPLMLSEARIAVTPLNGRLRLGGTLELAGLDLSINQRRVNAIRRGTAEYLHPVSGEREEVWRGLRPCSPDGLPIIGRPAHLDNFFLATGHGILGVSLAPITGKLVAQMVKGEKIERDLRLISPDRFR